MSYYLKRYKSPVANAKISLDQPIIIQTLLGNIKVEKSINNSRPLSSFEKLYFWDLGKKASEKIEVGDIIYIVTKSYIYMGLIEIHITDDDGGIGDAIGWYRQFTKPWVNPIGLSNVKKTVIDEKTNNILNDAINTSTKLTSSFYQLHRKIDFNQESVHHPVSIDEDQRDKNKQDLTSYSSKQVNIDNHQPWVTQTSEIFVEDANLTKLLDQLKLLQSSSHHSEREHESLVEKFFEFLGYSYPKDIKYRVGHVDVMVNEGSQNSMVVEVKRDWNLDRSSKQVVDQAFRYAVNCGSRFVIITNGDYYAFYDRLRGLSVSENFDFDFYLSKIQKNDIQLLKKYRKSSLE